jgi:hypothetical protein
MLLEGHDEESRFHAEERILATKPRWVDEPFAPTVKPAQKRAADILSAQLFGYVGLSVYPRISG